MEKTWEEVKWIFRGDGALRDLYIKNTTIDDWKNLIDFLNKTYLVKFGPSGDNEIKRPIDKDYAIKYLNSTFGDLESKTISVLLGEILANCHLFAIEEIEFDIAPSEIKSVLHFKLVWDFMNNVSRILKKEIILTGENERDFPLITIDYSKNKIEMLSENEIKEIWKKNKK